MTNQPKIIDDVESAFKDLTLDSDKDYWFSYRNRDGDRLDVFVGKIIIQIGAQVTEVLTKEIQDVEICVGDIRTGKGCGVRLRASGEIVAVEIDTVSKGQFLDVFPIHKSLKRRVIVDGGVTR